LGSYPRNFLTQINQDLPPDVLRLWP